MNQHRVQWLVGCCSGVLCAIMLMSAYASTATAQTATRTVKKPTMVQRTVTTKPVAISFNGWRGVATRRGGTPISVKLTGRGLSQLGSARAVNLQGATARGIEVKLGSGTDVQRLITLVVKAEALAGRYGIVGFSRQTPGIPLGGGPMLDLTVLESGLGQSPISAMMAMLGMGKLPGTAVTPPVPGQRTPDELAQARSDLSSTLGGSTGSPIGRELPSRSPGAGDSRLMTGESSTTDDANADNASADKAATTTTTSSDGTTTTTTDNGDGTSTTTTTKPDGTKTTTTGPTTVTVESSSNDQTKSDGTASVTNTTKTTGSDGSWMVDVMTYSRDANGNTKETQTVTAGNAGGATDYSHTCSGKCTPNPEDGGCSGGKACENFKAIYLAAFPLVGVMEKKFVEAKFGSLGGDSREPTGEAANPDMLTRPDGGTIIEQRAAPYINPNPEGGSNTGSTTTVPPRVLGQPKPIDPDRDTTTTSPVPPRPIRR